MESWAQKNQRGSTTLRGHEDCQSDTNDMHELHWTCSSLASQQTVATCVQTIALYHVKDSTTDAGQGR